MAKYFSLFLLSLLLLSCAEEQMHLPTGEDAVPLSGIEVCVDGEKASRAPALDKDFYVGRSRFIDKDVLTLTQIQRTSQPIDGFSYRGIVYTHAVGEGQTSGGWTRDDTKGQTNTNPPRTPDRIYWSDAHNPHTFIGYSLPQQAEAVTFDWKNTVCYTTDAEGKQVGIDTYFGSLGNPFILDDTIDHTDSTKIVRDDLLLTYDTQKLAEPGGSVAKLYFKHALANVRVIVNISGFSASNESADVLSRVSDMVYTDMPTLYKWRQGSAAAQALTADDQAALDVLYPEAAPQYDQKKDTKAWIPRPEGTGTGVGKQFVFYALAVPATRSDFTMKFTVSYQDPMEPWKDPSTKLQPNMKSHRYTAKMPTEVEFRGGYCTTIHINLNHRNEEMTVGAEYMDWQFVETPDNGQLHKKQNMLTPEMLQRSNFTIFGDARATEDDATWLYVNPTTQKLSDIYGNDGSQAHPFLISTAQELVSFAHEVKGTNRTPVTYKNLSGTPVSLTAAKPYFDFTGYYVKLDANIVLQPELFLPENVCIDWCGIGLHCDEANEESRFNGFFQGNGSSIRNLKGKPFFFHLGPNSVVEYLEFSEVVKVDGCGIVANHSEGLVCAVYAEGKIRQTEPANKEIYSGSLIGTIEENSCMIGCAHVGAVEAWATGKGTIGGLVGYNKGLLVSCYHSGTEKNLDKSVEDNYHTYAGVGAYDEVNSYAYCCYFNSDIDPTKTDYPTFAPGRLCFPLLTSQMQSEDFVNSVEELIVSNQIDIEFFEHHWSLNKGLDLFMEKLNNGEFSNYFANAANREWLKNHGSAYRYTYVPGTYPRIK